MSDTLTIEQIAEYLVNKTLSKPQLTQREASELYGEQRVGKWIRAGLLKPASQNGRGTKTYYDHKKIIKLSNEYRTYLKKV
ncbi:hypothetical protein ACFSQ3_13010 [Sphingobacterium corticis]|uniref:HTH merR-type domain-containing protein n=1 Tax=Sphingobacterium corticis TaxID=1812823 RepID=A0ABW5NLT0_9SPHI